MVPLAFGAVAITSTRVGDVTKRTGTRIAKAIQSAEQAVLGPPIDARSVAKPAEVAGMVLPSLSAPQAAIDGSVLKQAYLAAATNERLRSLGYDPTGFMEALALYRADNLAGGDAASAGINNPIMRAALDWVALHAPSGRIPLTRFTSFQASHPGWPDRTWFRHQIEARMLHNADVAAVERYFTENPPVSALGKLALAKALKADNKTSQASALARAVFRDADLPASIESRLKSDYGAELSKADYKFKADRLVYKEQFGAALHFAAEAGPDVIALERARITLAGNNGDKALQAVPETLRRDPGLILAQVQRLRRADRLMDAANLMQSAPKELDQLIDGDEWWTERRVLARRLLDNGNINAAYVICATHPSGSDEARVEAEFHAGWIALRFMNDAKRASYHFNQAAVLVESPTSLARIAYWQGRTAEVAGGPDSAELAASFYNKAAIHTATYYGQLARQVLGLDSNAVQEPAVDAVGTRRDEAIQVIELLYAAGERDAATALASDAAAKLDSPEQIGALANVIEAQHDAHLSLTIGKLVGQRNVPVDTLAFPTFGIPPYDALKNSASPPIVYAIARQESAFIPGAVSKAGAKGLMQMIDATAKRTAQKAGLPFDSNRLVADPAFNAQLGAAHLGELLAEQGGSMILTFAAYNAGGGHVKEWIDAYGDPRNPGVDPIDWIERIPFSETRNYVQRVLANVTMYQAIFAEKAKALSAANAEAVQAKL